MGQVKLLGKVQPELVQALHVVCMLSGGVVDDLIFVFVKTDNIIIVVNIFVNRACLEKWQYKEDLKSVCWSVKIYVLVSRMKNNNLMKIYIYTN